MAGSFLLVSLIALVVFIVTGFSKSIVIGEIQNQFSQLGPREQIQTRIFFSKAQRLHLSYIHPYFWSFLGETILTLTLFFNKYPFSLKGSQFIIAGGVYILLLIVVEVGYTPYRKKLMIEMAVWEKQNSKKAVLINQIRE